MKAAIYCRVSTKDQNCDRQEADLLAFAERVGYEVIGIYKETESGVKLNRRQRDKVMALARDRRVDAVLVTELTRWGRSTIDLIRCLQDFYVWNVKLIAQTGIQFDVATAQGKLLATVLSALAEFERDLVIERIKSGLASAKAKGKKLGRRPGDRVKLDRLEGKILELIAQGMSYRRIGRELNISPTTVYKLMKKKYAEAHRTEVDTDAEPV